jgi:hypothetical protein
VIPHLVVADRKVLPDPHVRHDHGLRVQRAEDDSALVLAPLDGEPEPLGLARLLIDDLEFNVVAALVSAHQIGFYHRVPRLRAETNWRSHQRLETTA